ncbi:membrane protein [Alkalibacillus filiformis]|uniref:Membrane protein n=1 Tax=Alkalibacillus filiformis TaxID=200990 RepID=A0ABU0DUH2_9BACI|nr:YihY/virulence factor BrkB family protein [Alkalibacillus filiformis]MDQ0351984.1 membrane protein [Alkalibacillus filiformis]
MIFEKKFWKELFHRFSADEVPALSASLAYFFLLSLLPFMIFLLTLVGFLPINHDQVFRLVDDYFPPDTMGLVRDNIDHLMAQRNGGLLSLGLIGTIWAASIGVNGLIRAFNRAYEINEERPFFVTRGLAIALTVLMVLVIAVALVLPVFGRLLGEFFFSFFGVTEQFLAVWESMRWVVSAFVMIFVLTVLYIAAPSRKIKFAHAIPGAAIATIGWQVLSIGFAFYVENFGQYSATYGSLAGVIVLMVWLFLSGMMIIIGGEINAILHKYKGRLISK